MLKDDSIMYDLICILKEEILGFNIINIKMLKARQVDINISNG